MIAKLNRQVLKKKHGIFLEEKANI